MSSQPTTDNSAIATVSLMRSHNSGSGINVSAVLSRICSHVCPIIGLIKGGCPKSHIKTNSTKTGMHVQYMICEDLDREGDGQRSDFEDLLNVKSRKQKEKAIEKVKEAFKLFDGNRDGYISANELQKGMIRLGERLTEEEVEEMIKEADLDGDGLVSYVEFERIMLTGS